MTFNIKIGNYMEHKWEQKLAWALDINELVENFVKKIQHLSENAAVFYRAGFIESWGRGIRKICEGFECANLPEPEFESHCGGIRVTVMIPNEKTGLKTGLKTDMGELTLKMKGLIDENPSVSIDKLAITMGLSRNGVKYHLNTLKEKMGLIRVGGRKNGHWKFHED